MLLERTWAQLLEDQLALGHADLAGGRGFVLMHLRLPLAYLELLVLGGDGASRPHGNPHDAVDVSGAQREASLGELPPRIERVVPPQATTIARASLLVKDFKYSYSWS